MVNSLHSMLFGYFPATSIFTVFFLFFLSFISQYLHFILQTLLTEDLLFCVFCFRICFASHVYLSQAYKEGRTAPAFMFHSTIASKSGIALSHLSYKCMILFFSGVPKLKRAELEAACEDFSNVIGSSPIGTVYKGTLSSGVEIAVTSIAVTSAKEWSTNLEAQFRDKVDCFGV